MPSLGAAACSACARCAAAAECAAAPPQVYVHDVKHVVLDNLQFMTSGQGTGYERFDTMDRKGNE